MQDPFPIRPSPWLSEMIEPWATRLHLYSLPSHIHEIMLAALFYLALETHISPSVSTWLFGKRYSGLSASKRKDWDAHVVSFVQSFIIGAVALWAMAADDERATSQWQDRVWGYSGMGGMLQAFVVGYFIWDLSICLRHMELFGVSMLAHALCALSVYTLSFRPVLNYYSSTFMMYELSNPFMNVHWFLRQLGHHNSRLQVLNGLALFGSFFACRIAYGGAATVAVVRDIWRAVQASSMSASSSAAGAHLGGFRTIHVQAWDASSGTTTTAALRSLTVAETLPLWVAATCLTSSLVLNGLNLFWFRKMLAVLWARCGPATATAPVAPTTTTKTESKSAPAPVVADASSSSQAKPLAATRLAATKASSKGSGRKHVQ